MVKSLKDAILEDLESMYTFDLISLKQKKIYEDILDSADKEVMLLVKSQILESVQNDIDGTHDIDTLYTLITSLRNKSEELKEFILTTLEDPESFKIFKLEGFDIYKIYEFKYSRKVSPLERIENTVYHAIIKFKFLDKQYSFGYNPAQNVLSFTVNGGPIKYFQIFSECESLIEEEIKEALAVTLNVFLIQ